MQKLSWCLLRTLSYHRFLPLSVEWVGIQSCLLRWQPGILPVLFMPSCLHSISFLPMLFEQRLTYNENNKLHFCMSVDDLWFALIWPPWQTGHWTSSNKRTSHTSPHVFGSGSLVAGKVASDSKSLELCNPTPQVLHSLSVVVLIARLPGVHVHQATLFGAPHLKVTRCVFSWSFFCGKPEGDKFWVRFELDMVGSYLKVITYGRSKPESDKLW